LGSENRIFPHVCLGGDPQDLKFQGERVVLIVGSRNTFREFVTVHRGTAKGGGVTRIGDDNLFMVGAHIAHDCQVGNRTILANQATLAGHAELHDDAVVGAFAAIQPFGRIGRFAYIGGFSRLLLDALPYVKTVGIRPVVLGINRIGMERKGFDRERIRRIEAAVKRLLVRGRPMSEVRSELAEAAREDPDLQYLVEFLKSSRRGVILARPGRGRESGEGWEG
jgi:UDP-N-acetylglucosamine acyltransferase